MSFSACCLEDTVGEAGVFGSKLVQVVDRAEFTWKNKHADPEIARDLLTFFGGCPIRWCIPAIVMELPIPSAHQFAAATPI